MYLYLLPPSEGKNAGGIEAMTSRRFEFSLPLDIAQHATEKDLKCSGKRYEEGMSLNKHLINAVKTPLPSASPLARGEH